MVANDKATIDRSTPSGTTDHHPAAGHGGGKHAEPPNPRRPVRAGNGDDHRAGKVLFFFRPANVPRRWQIDAAVTIRPVAFFDRTVRPNRADRCIQPAEQTLTFTDRVSVQHTAPAGVAIASPPRVDRISRDLVRLPTIDRQSERGFGDE